MFTPLETIQTNTMDVIKQNWPDKYQEIEKLLT